MRWSTYLKTGTLLYAEEPDEELLLIEARDGTLGELGEIVRASGPVVVAAAVRAILRDDASDRKRAQLLLTCFDSLPRHAYVALEGSEGIIPWAFSMLSRRLASDFLLDPEDQAFVRELEGEEDPLKILAADLGSRLCIPESELESLKEDFVEDYTREYLPRLAELWEHVGWFERFFIDLDGDGVEEFVVASNDLWDTFWVHEFRFIALLRRESRSSPWSVARFELLCEREEILETVVGDFDRDGTREVLVRSHMPGGGTGFVHMVSLQCPQPADSFPVLYSYKPSCRVFMLELSRLHARAVAGRSRALRHVRVLPRQFYRRGVRGDWRTRLGEGAVCVEGGLV